MGLSRLAALTTILLLLGACRGSGNLPPLAPTARILAFGDSLTFGVGATPERNYPATLKTLVRREVINAGEPGETSADGVKRLSFLLNMIRPDLLILCHGFDDLQRRMDYTRTADNVRAMVQLAQSHRTPMILVAAPRIRTMTTPAFFYGTIALQSGVPFEPGVVSHVLNDDSLTSNHVHPNAQGYRVIAEALASRLRNEGAL
jgi:acyl-CoA thioesterase-1